MNSPQGYLCFVPYASNWLLREFRDRTVAQCKVPNPVPWRECASAWARDVGDAADRVRRYIQRYGVNWT